MVERSSFLFEPALQRCMPLDQCTKRRQLLILGPRGAKNQPDFHLTVNAPMLLLTSQNPTTNV
jgi:hypothetical protein